MKKTIILLILISFLSCKVKERANNNTENSKPIENRKSDIDWELVKNFEERKTNYEDVIYIDYSSSKIYKPKPSFEVEYKEYNKGRIAVKKTILGKYLFVGISEYYDENGKVVKRVDENKKFENFKFKPIDILKFIEKLGVINLKTGEGRRCKTAPAADSFNIRFSNGIYYISIINGKRIYKRDFEIKNTSKENKNIENIYDENAPKSIISAEIFNEKYEINAQTGEIKDEKGNVIIFKDFLPQKPYKTFEGKEYTKEEWAKKEREGTMGSTPKEE